MDATLAMVNHYQLFNNFNYCYFSYFVIRKKTALCANAYICMGIISDFSALAGL